MLKTRHKVLLITQLVLFAIFSLFLTSCTSNQKEISFVFMRRNEDTDAYWQKVAADFEATHPGVKVNLQVFDWADGPTKIQEMIDAGTPPDVLHVATRELGDYIAKGWVSAIDSYMTPEFKAEFFPRVLNASAQYEGRTFGLPVSVTTRALYYNKDLFARAGIDAPPTTWEELREDAIKISELGPDIYGFGLQGKSTETELYFYYFLASNGGDFLSPDSTRATFNRDEGVEALEYLADLVKSGATPPDPGQFSKSSLREAFIAGQLGMMIDSDSLKGKLEGAGHPFDYDIAPIPAHSKSAVIGVTDSLTLFSQSNNRDLAWEFLAFAFQDQYRLEYAQHEGYLPEKVTIADEYSKESSANSFFMSQLPDAQFAPMNVKSADIASRISEAVLSVYRGEADARTALNAAAADINEWLAYSATSW